jgi:hypothetical protein
MRPSPLKASSAARCSSRNDQRIEFTLVFAGRAVVSTLSLRFTLVWSLRAVVSTPSLHRITAVLTDH